MGTSTVEQLLENVCLLLASRTRDVVKSALGFIKVAVVVMDVVHLAKHVQLVMGAIGKLSDDMRRHFRMKLRNLFTKFIRKFGFELVKKLLPEEYHKVLCPVDGRPPISRPLSREMDYTAYPWFAGNMERQQTDNLLKSHPSGTYLIRERPAEAERFAISIKFNDEVKHIKVVEKDSWVHITEAKKFESLLELVEYYQCHSLKESFKQLDTTLKYPYKARERTASRASSRSPVFTPRVIGTAVARYNFAARDLRELSLREGDVVKIYSRIGGDQGWWKGETNGRVGWFPSTYVEEEGVQ